MTRIVSVRLLEAGGLVAAAADGREAALHPIWLRERTPQPDAFDAVNRQRLFDPAELPDDLAVREASVDPALGQLSLRFSDGHVCALDAAALAGELGWIQPSEEPPQPEPWDGALVERPTAPWAALDDPGTLRDLLAGFFRTGFCLLTECGRERGTLERVAERFGYLRETNFGRLFDVETKPNPIDLAYTGRALTAHADNPYRKPIPGIQLLHCVESEVAGGLSTLVDGLAVAERLQRDHPAEAEALARLPVRFRYESACAIFESHGPLIERGRDGRVERVRFSTRLDYPPPADPETLSLFYRGRRLFHRLASDPANRIAFRIDPGAVLMMDNHRLLHGRTAFEGEGGRRLLQGCYIDHDGPDSLYRVLARDGAARAVGREAA
ncbi:MAG: clavaminate synthase family protein [Alphaproteobacteria bacterium]|nr:clavaminate synthase family protein [Alphaproteobacteria bacterium]